MRLFRLEVSIQGSSKRYYIGRYALHYTHLMFWMKDHMYLTIHSVKETTSTLEWQNKQPKYQPALTVEERLGSWRNK